jgi:DNA processing protein
VTDGACNRCLHRSHVIATLAGRIEGMLQRPGSRVGMLLSLPTPELVEALVPAERVTEATAEIARFDPDAIRERSARAELAMLCAHADRYPGALHELPDAPPVLWVRGGTQRLTELLSESCVAIVGTRRPSAYGVEVAEQLARGLSASGVSVISGLALGIDAAAHRGALAAVKPRTIAVLGSGADVVYPRANRALYDSIAARGAVVSESPPGRRPFRWTFPARNRIMAALSALTIVVEASDPSGSLITAAFAADLGRGVAAVPGRVTATSAAGTNRLLRDGAALVRGAADALDELFGVGGADRLATSSARPVSDEEARVLGAIEDGTELGAIATITGLEPARVRVLLGVLESAGLVRRSGIGLYERTAVSVSGRR